MRRNNVYKSKTLVSIVVALFVISMFIVVILSFIGYTIGVNLVSYIVSGLIIILTGIQLSTGDKLQALFVIAPIIIPILILSDRNMQHGKYNSGTVTIVHNLSFILTILGIMWSVVLMMNDEPNALTILSLITYIAILYYNILLNR